ncbi:hypothetical protein [Ruegeria atlantica]|uniref:hypothetical protein n=1 Tax=Ruegeria atlantica TaxID=81569 RepID=UPI0011AE1AA3|nr:hypothetical protein [Ruegeria atlantica]
MVKTLWKTWEYSTSFGGFTRTLLERPVDPWGGSTVIIPIKATAIDYGSLQDTFPRGNLTWLLVLGAGDRCVGLPHSNKKDATEKAEVFKRHGVDHAQVFPLHQQPYGTTGGSVKKFATGAKPCFQSLRSSKMEWLQLRGMAQRSPTYCPKHFGH